MSVGQLACCQPEMLARPKPGEPCVCGQLACCQPEMLTRPKPGEPCVCWPVGLLSTRDVD